jgi:inosose dehydratase
MLMTTFHLGNAPCSWGTIENTGRGVPFERMLTELADTGYQGTELGDWGYMPTDPARLRDELSQRGLTLIGSWVTVRLSDAAYHREGLENALRVARLLREVGGERAVVNLGDDHGGARHRFERAGRIRPEDGLDEDGWRVFTQGAQAIAKAVRDETGLRTTLHPHGATWVETPREVREFLDRTDPTLIGICFDTGHYALGGGDPVRGVRDCAERIWLMHFKDFDSSVLERAEAEGWDYRQMIGAGVFSELGRGSVDFPAVLSALRDVGYEGWIVVEQDVLPGLGDPRASAARNREYLRGVGL